MKCAFHAEVENTAFCIRCGRPLCADCIRSVRGSVYCENCIAECVQGAPPQKKVEVASGENPGAAFVLGLIPGVGAVYNGEYFKAAVHILIFALLVSIAEASWGFTGTLFGFLAFGFFVYMPFEAYYTAKKRKLRREGVELQTPFDRINEQLEGIQDRDLWGGVALIGVGLLFLMDTFGVLHFDKIVRGWPVLLIALGAWLLKRRRERT